MSSKVPANQPPLIIACGALAAELRAVLDQQGLANAVELKWLPATLHNRPERIVPRVKAVLEAAVGRRVLVAYADCGTGGDLDRLLAHYPNSQRLPGAHCYEFFAGSATFNLLHEQEPGTFYLSDFLARHFETLVWKGLGMDRHPELVSMYFGNYTRLLHIAQTGDPVVSAAAQQAAGRLGLPLETRLVGYGELPHAVAVAIGSAEAA